MNRSATRMDYQQLSPEQRAAHARVLHACLESKLPCRCEVIDGREFSIVVAPGLSAAKYWIDKLDADAPTTT